MAEAHLGGVARDAEGAAPAPTPTPSDDDGGVAEDTEDAEDADTEREASRIEPDPVEDASGRMTAGDEEAPREEL
jgi:hypothetical protein